MCEFNRQNVHFDCYLLSAMFSANVKDNFAERTGEEEENVLSVRIVSSNQLWIISNGDMLYSD